MEQKPQTEQPPKPDENYNPGDEKTKIIEDFAPEKTRPETTPLPKIHTEEDTKTSSRTISEFKVFGPGTVDLLCCRFDPDDFYIASGKNVSHSCN